MTKQTYLQNLEAAESSTICERFAKNFADNEPFSEREADSYVDLLKRNQIERDVSGLTKDVRYTGRIPKMSRFRKTESKTDSEKEFVR